MVVAKWGQWVITNLVVGVRLRFRGVVVVAARRCLGDLVLEEGVMELN